MKTEARLDLIQSGSGLVLALFMWLHLLLVSSILISKDAMFWVARAFEGEPLFGEPYPILVSMVALLITLLMVIHALLALRKFPANYRAHSGFVSHMFRFKHQDTLLWYVQVLTGFALFFLASVHLYQLLLHPGDIGPYASSDRIYSGRMWPLYLVLLFVVELHGGIGIYRVLIKWGFFIGNNAKQSRRKMAIVKWWLTGFFIVLGLTTLAAYMKIGAAHADHVGERYVPHQTLTAPLDPRGQP